MPGKKKANGSGRLEGVIVAAIAPRRSEELSIDLGATLELIDFLGEREVAGIALMGSTGEFVHFALDDRRHMVNFAAKRSRVPLLVNVSHTTLDGAVDLAREAAAAGVAGLLLMPPYYFRYSQDEVRAFFQTFAATVATDIPIYLYNIPGFTNDISLPVASELLSGGQFAGIKDSSGSPEYFTGLRQLLDTTAFSLFAGVDRLYVAQRRAGAHGAVSGVASVLPELLVALDRAIVAGDEGRIARLEARLSEFQNWTDLFPWPAAVKEAVRQRKLQSGALATPLSAEKEAKLAEFAGWFRNWLPDVLCDCR